MPLKHRMSAKKELGTRRWSRKARRKEERGGRVRKRMPSRGTMRWRREKEGKEGNEEEEGKERGRE